MVRLRKITEENYRECFSLKVADNQIGFVASNLYSIAQAWVNYNTTYPFAIYSDNIMVGFIMMDYEEEKGKYWIVRLMVAEKFQRSGYGKAALNLAIEYLKKEFSVKEIFLSFSPKNTVAKSLYENVGFISTGEVEDGEIVMRLNVHEHEKINRGIIEKIENKN